MLTTLALCFALRPSAAISLPAGFYSLQDVADTLAKQNVTVAVAPSCAQETYAIRAEGVEWDKLRTALEADERLSITESKHGWQIERSVTVKRDESIARDRYSTYALNTTHSFFVGVARLCAEMEARPQDEREAAVEKARKDAGSDQVKADAAQQFYLYSAEHDMPFFELAMPATLTDSNIGGFGRAVSTNLFEARYQFIPDGDLSKFPVIPRTAITPDAKERAARSVRVIAKLVWDPVSVAMAFRIVLLQDGPSMNPAGVAVTDFVPKRFRLSIPVDAVWNEASRNAVAARIKATVAALTGDPIKAAGAMPHRSVRVGEALLRAAEAAKTNVIYYVSPLTDYPLPAVDAKSIAGVVAEVNGGQIDVNELASEASERLGTRDNGPRPPAFKSPANLTATLKNGILVVRNEVRFLDGLSGTTSVLSNEFQNNLLHDQTPKIGEIASVVTKAPIGGISSDSLDVCNPIAFRPFAAALVASPALMKTAVGLDGAATTVTFASLDSSARAAILSEIQRCGPLLDAAQGLQSDPLLTSELISKIGTANLNVQISHFGSEYRFQLLDGKEPLWTARVRNTGPG